MGVSIGRFNLRGDERRMGYLSMARLPTEKAHGYQIVKMCEAFARAGEIVALYHPFRKQPDHRLHKVTIFDYYAVRCEFESVTLPNWDLIPFTSRLPRPIFQAVWLIHAVIWSRLAARRLERNRLAWTLTRSPIAADALTRRGLPTVLELHTIPTGPQQRFLLATAERPSFLGAVALTRELSRRLFDFGLPRERVIVAHDAVDLGRFGDLPGRPDARRQLDLPPDRPIIGYVGRFTAMNRDKGLGILAEAVAKMDPVDGREPLLLAVGGPIDAVNPIFERLRGEGLPDKRMYFHDRVPTQQVPCWIRACDVVTIPWGWSEFSAYFTSPLKLFEYMAAGVPIVASDLPSLREILQDGANAVLVPPDDPEALRTALRTVLEHPDYAARLAAKARQDVQDHTWDNRARMILQACRNWLLAG